MASLQTFCDKNKIPYLRFNQEIKNQKKIEGTNTLPSSWNNMDYEKSMEKNKTRFGKFANINWKKSKYMVVDIDEEGDWWKEYFPDTVMTTSTGKGLPHLIYEKHDDDPWTGNNRGLFIKGKKCGDLCYKNTFEHWDAEIVGTPTKLEFIPNMFTRIKETKKDTTKKKKTTAQHNYLSARIREEVKTLLDMNTVDAEHYDEWRNIIIACRNIHPSLKQEAIEWSMTSSKFDEKTFDEKWGDKNPFTGLGMHTLKTRAMKNNRTAYLTWTNRELYMTPEYFSDVFMDKFGNDNLVYTDGRLFIFMNGNWFEDNEKRVMKKKIREVTQGYLKGQLKEYDDNGDPFNTNKSKITKQLEKVQRRGMIDDIASFIMQNLSADTCSLSSKIVFDVCEEQLYNLHFKNGVLHLGGEDIQWSNQRTHEDKVTVGNSVNMWNFDPFEIDEELVKEVENDFRKVQPDDEQRRFMLEWLAYGLTGDTSRQQCKFNIGLRASNGKTTEFLIHSKCFPKLIKNVERKYFCETYSKRHKIKIDLLTKPIRIVYLEEMDEHQLDGSELKDAVDGKKQNCEIMYGTNIEGRFQCKWNFLGQREPVIKEDEGVLRRGIMQQYTSKFSENVNTDDWEKKIFPRIKDFENKYNDDKYKNAYLHLLLDHYKGSNFKIPPENTESFINYVKEINGDRDLAELFENGTKDDWLSKKELATALKKNVGGVKEFMKNFCPWSKYDPEKRIRGNPRGAYNNIKMKID